MQGYVKGFKIVYPKSYSLLYGDTKLDLTGAVGRHIKLSHTGKFACCYCGRSIKKTYHGGYCFPCMQNLARCDLCVVKPELCHFHLGTCREPEWGLNHCMKPHILYASYTSGLKVGLTRKERLKNRWLEQGALGAVALLELNSRYHAGLIESHMAASIADKTNWRKMLAQETLPENVWIQNKEHILDLMGKALFAHTDKVTDYKLIEPKWFDLAIDVVVPQKIKSIKPKLDEPIEGVLKAFRGHYMVFDEAVVNMRSLVGYELNITID